MNVGFIVRVSLKLIVVSVAVLLVSSFAHAQDFGWAERIAGPIAFPPFRPTTRLS